MSRPPFGVSPPSGVDPRLNEWLQWVTDTLRALPAFSLFSTADGPNTSGITANAATLGVEIGSSSTKLWIKSQSGTTHWKPLG